MVPCVKFGSLSHWGTNCLGHTVEKSEPHVVRPVFLNVLVATQHNWSWLVKASDNGGGGGAKWLCTQTMGTHWLMDAVHPFGIQHAACGIDRFKLTLWAVSVVLLGYLHLRSGLDGPPHPYTLCTSSEYHHLGTAAAATRAVLPHSLDASLFIYPHIVRNIY